MMVICASRMKNKICRFHHAHCKSAEERQKRRIAVRTKRRQVTNLTLRLLLFLGKKRTFLLAFSLKLIFRVSLLNVRLF